MALLIGDKINQRKVKNPKRSELVAGPQKDWWLDKVLKIWS